MQHQLIERVHGAAGTADVEDLRTRGEERGGEGVRPLLRCRLRRVQSLLDDLVMRVAERHMRELMGECEPLAEGRLSRREDDRARAAIGEGETVT